VANWKLTFSIIEEEIRRLLGYKKNIVFIIAFVAFEVVFTIFTMQQMIKEQVFLAAWLLQLFTKTFTYSYIISLGIFIAYGLSIDNFTSDKQNKALETILATPLSLENLWLAKSLALFLVSYFSMVVVFISFIISGNLIIAGSLIYIPEISIWVSLLLVFPFTCFSAIGLMGIGILISRKIVAVNFTTFIIAFLLMFIPSFLRSEFLEISASLLTITYAGITAILLIIVLVCKKILLQKERVVLNI
jgi:hypothetical protein